MKLSFSTKGWHDRSFDDFCDIAVDLKFQGIELHNIHNELFTEKDGAFHKSAAPKTVRKLYEKKLTIPCIDSICNLADASKKAETVKEISACIDIADDLNIPYIRIKAYGFEDMDYIRSVITEILPLAEEKGRVLLLETSGVFANTATLRDLLDSFACDSLAALWDMYAPYFYNGEDAETTIKNLGAYVKQVHIKDAVKNEDGIEICL